MSIYFIQLNEFVKIGYAKNVNHRLSAIQAATPYEVEVIGTIETKNAKRMESGLHARFAPYHHRGEWYHASEPLLAYIAVEANEPSNVIERGQAVPPSILQWVKVMQAKINEMRDSIPTQDMPAQLYLF